MIQSVNYHGIYNSSVQNDGPANGSGGLIHRPKPYTEPGQPAPAPNTPSRPDWLDDVEPGEESQDPARDAQSDAPVPERNVAVQNIDSAGTDHAETAHKQSTKIAARQAKSDKSLAEPVADLYPATRQSTDSDWTQTGDATAPTPRHSIPPVANPLAVEWFVQEEDAEPSQPTAEDALTPEAKAKPEAKVEADSLRAAEVETGTACPTSAEPAAQATPQPVEMPAQSAPAVDAVSATAVAPPNHTTAIEKDIYTDRRYRAALERMQFAQWSETLVLLRAVQRDYPHNPNIAALINEAELKAGVAEAWVGKVRGRRLTVRQEAILRRAIPILLLLLLFVGAAGFYRVFVEPSRQAVAATQTSLRMLEEARQLAFAGRFSEALAVYNQILERDPGNPLARQGLHEAEGLYALATEYNVAMSVAQAGNLSRAVGILEDLLAKSPGFRDVETQLTVLETELEARRLFAAAEADYRLARWESAVQGYEALVALGTDIESNTTQLRLQESYLRAGQEIVRRWPATHEEIALAQEYFQRASATRRSDTDVQTELNRLDRYYRGTQAVEQSDLREAVNVWRSLYDEEPQYMGGYLADQLYRAYLSLANRAVQQNDTIYAIDLYQLALELEVRNKSEAQRALDQLRAQAVAPNLILG